MRDEIIGKAYASDTSAKPRYILVDSEGNILQEGIEILLMNEVLQQGTPYSKAAVLTDSTAAKLSPGAVNLTPAEAFEAIANQVFTVGDMHEGKFLRVKNGVAVWETVPSAEGGSF